MATWIIAVSVPIAAYLTLSGLDDLVVDLIWWWVIFFRPTKLPASEDLERMPHRRTAIFVPLWHEHPVIEQMLSHNLATVQYSNYTVFVGVYPNDPLTIEAVERAAARLPNVRVAQVPHPGPTSKGDCLNWIYQQMLSDEESYDIRYDMVITHDAEDMIHPRALQWINYCLEDHDFVQIPVLALKTPPLALTHGMYCDEFAEMHTRDLAVRAATGAFIPSAGVGTGYSRRALEALAEQDSNQIFIPGCLTEDYENGLRLHQLGLRQTFLPILKEPGGTFVATREYFPQSFSTAIKQRTRWVTGIGLQSWQRNGWGGGDWRTRYCWRTRYWMWRDRKGLLGSPLGLLTSVLFLAGCVSRPAWAEVPTPVQVLFAVTTLLGLYRIGFRAGCVARVYGVSMAIFVPIRVVWGNWINGIATVRAIVRYTAARVNGSTLAWTKTTHEYPSRAALLGQRLKLGEILIQSGIANPAVIGDALRNKGEDIRLGEYLMRIHAITEEQLYEALALQQHLPLAAPDAATIPRKVARALPVRFIRDRKVMAFAIDERGIHLCSPDTPTQELASLLHEHTRLALHFHLITPSRFKDLASEALERRTTGVLTLAAGSQ